MCEAADIQVTLPAHRALSESELEVALAQYIEEASDTLKNVFDKAFRQRKKTKYDNAKLVIQALSTFDENGATKSDLTTAIEKVEPKFPASNFDYFVKKLQTDEYGGIIRHEPVSGTFAFADPIYRVFALAYFKLKKPQSTKDREINWVKVLDLLREDIAKELSSSFQLNIKFDKRS